MIDNYDSFTFNLVQYFFELGAEVEVVRNDATDVTAVAAAVTSGCVDAIVLSPGPCSPNEAGVSLPILAAHGRELPESLPILGVCLGHQAIGQAFGGRIVHASRIMHGKTSSVRHRGEGVFNGLPDPFIATRYHSLVIEQSSLPEILEVTAWTEHDDGRVEEIMGVRHRSRPIEGVQFHPESILTENGHALLRNFLVRVEFGRDQTGIASPK
ncbi:MAG: anthranilate synthase component II [Thioalkalivibrionaceae bacterium]